MYIKAPFNFVPLSDKVYTPDWANQISHDIPFEDGLSGIIDLKITAKTPVFVRNGHTPKDAEEKSDGYKSFSKVDDKYFIPATSIKGMLRTVLEIISFGKMNRVSNNRYSIRDLRNRVDYMDIMTGNHTFCGWMKINKQNRRIEITDCGSPGRISHKEIDTHLGKGFEATFSDRDLLRSDDNRTSRYKYTIIAGDTNKLTGYFKYDQEKNEKSPRVDKRVFYKFSDENNGEFGNIVFTGQPGPRQFNRRTNRWTGKFYEFIFFDKPNPEIHSFDQDSELWNDFLFINKDAEDWKYLSKKFPEKIPVFFKKNEEDNIESLGLSYLYKLPYKNRITDCLPVSHKKNEPDLSDLIFGCSDYGLKGRVQLSHAFLEEGSTLKLPLKPLMGSPKPSYYPIYLKQKGKDGIAYYPFITYNNVNSELKGWKRYPVHKKETSDFTFDKSQEKNTSPFIPIESGSKFKCKIRFHNLKRIELGALINAITFCQNDKTFHSIGLAKPYGYGKIKVEIKETVGFKNEEISELAKEFQEFIKKKINGWADSSQITELITMATEQTNDGRGELSYMPLEDFPKMKNRNTARYLDYYSNFFRSKSNNYQTTTLAEESVPITENSHTKITPEPDWIKALVTDVKEVIIEETNTKAQLVVPKFLQNVEYKKDQHVWVKIKQKSKDGRIIQVEFKGLT